MIFITGPLYSGTRSYACEILGCCMEDLYKYAVWDAQDLAADCDELEALADRLAGHAVVIATEVGGGVVPIDPAERANRERAGRLSCLLARRAEKVVRVFCGLPMVLKETDI